MQDPAEMRQLMPLMREFGDLARKRVGVGVTPLEYQRYLDLKGRIGERFARPGMSLKIEKMNSVQSAGLSSIFAHALDRQLGWLD